MSSIDSRVVEAKFDNAQFESGIRTTLSSLDKLKAGLKLDGATKGLSDVDAAAKRMDLSHIANSVDAIKGKFGAMSIFAIAAMANIANRAVNMGLSVVKSFSIAPIKAGFENYETQINAVQTILANTGLKGAAGLNQVNDALGQLNTYANQTVYNFSEMARNIGTFTAAGVDLKTSTASIKGIANLAAMSGSNSQQASTAMYQLSQAIAANQVKLQDWNSVVNAGMGGKAFQKALFNTGQALHTIKSAKVGESFDQWTKAGNSFRGSLQDGWITGKVLTQTLQGFTGDLTAAQLKSMGYNAEQIKQIREQGQTALNAAVKVKTATQLMQALKEEVASAWSGIFKTVFGDINQATELFSKLHVVLENALTGPINAFNTVLQGWAKLGGRSVLIDAIALAFKELGRVIKPIKDAFRVIFPAKTAEDLYNMTTALHVFIENLNVSGPTLNRLKRIFVGVFAAFDIGWQVIKQTIHFIGDLFGMFRNNQNSHSILDVAGSVADFLYQLDQAIKTGHGLRTFFKGLEKAIQPVIQLFQRVVSAIAGVFSFKAPSSGQITKAFHPIDSLGHAILTVWLGVLHILGKVITEFAPFASKISSFFSHIGAAISDALGGINYEDFLHTINTALFAGLVLLIKKFVGNLGKGIQNPAKGFIQSVTEPFEAVTGTMKQMQNTLRAATLLEIAAALGIMTISVIALARVNAADLTRALTALAVMFTQLFTSMAVFQRIGGVKGLAATATGLILFATALRILTSAVKALSELSWQELAKGLVGVTVLIAALTLAVRGMSRDTGGMIRAGAGLALLAIGVRLLVTSVTALSGLSWGEMAKGLTGVAALLVGLTLFTKFADADKGGVLQGAGLILLATGIRILADATAEFAKISWGGIAKGLVSITAILAVFAIFSKSVGNPITLVASGAALIMISIAMTRLATAVAAFGEMKWSEIGKGLATMAGALTLIALALNALPPTALLSAAAILVVASSLKMIGDAIVKMGGLSWKEIAKGLVTLAGALGIIVIAMIGMSGTLAGAAATLVVAGALKVLAGVLVTLGGQSWGEIAKGLVTLAGVFAVLGVAGLVLAPLVPVLLGLGIAVGLLGLGVAAAGAGVLLFSIGLTALATSGAAAALAIVAIVTAILGVLPVIVKQLAFSIVVLAQGIAKAAPAVFAAMTAVAIGLLKTIQIVAPQLIHTIGLMMVLMAAEIAKDAPKLATSALIMMLGVLNALKSKMPAIIASFVDLLIRVMNEFTKAMPRLTTAGANLIVSILNGIAKNMGKVVTAGVNVIVSFIEGVANNLPKIIQAGFDLILKFVNGLSDAIDKNAPALGKAGGRLGGSMITGMLKGIAAGAGQIIDSFVNLAKEAWHKVKHFLHIGSPSKLFYDVGMWTSKGMALGISDYTGHVGDSAVLMGNAALTALQRTVADMHKISVNGMDLNPTITPVLDLSDVKAKSAKIGDLLTVPTISLGATFTQAKNASVSHTEARPKPPSPENPPGETPVQQTNYTQNNYSPKALSAADIYRQTKNQLSVTKGVPVDAGVS